MSTPTVIPELASPNAAGNVQWLRAASLKLAKRADVPSVVMTDQTPASTTLTLDLSDLHFRFQIQGSLFQTPNTCVVRIYNVSPATAKTIVDEYDQLSISAGYQSYSAIIFTGTIRQYKRGREGVTDNFIELLAATCDANYNFGFMNTTLGDAQSGATWRDVYNSLCAHFGVAEDTVTQGLIQAASRGFALQRGRATFGMARAIAGELALAINANWSIQTINGVNTLVLIQTAGVRPGQAIVLGPQTGLVGVPEATVDGVQAQSLLNPLLQVGVLVQINQDLITVTDVPLDRRALTHTLTPVTATTTATGFYQVMAVDHMGDTRGQEWYTNIICLAVGDTTAHRALTPTELTDIGRQP